MRTMDELNEIVKNLKESPLFNLSMANKELFHSNFLAWFGNNYNEKFKQLIIDLFKDFNWPKEIRQFTIDREYKHFDICIKDSSGPRILIENKVKSVPTKEQLAEYKGEVKNDTCLFILLTMTTHLHNMDKAEGWEIITYKDLSEELKNVVIDDPYHSKLIKDYCEYVNNLQNVIEIIDAERLYYSPSEQIINDLGIHDVCGKRKAQNLYDKLLKKCCDERLNVVTNIEKLSEDSIYVGWGYTNSPLIEVKFKNCSDVMVIQIQGKQYRHAVEFFENKIGDKIIQMDKDYNPSDIGLDYLRNNYSDMLSLTDPQEPNNYPFVDISFGQNKKKGYCKYCNGKMFNGVISCFVYQWVEIPQKITCDDLVDKILQDISRVKNRCRTNH